MILRSRNHINLSRILAEMHIYITSESQRSLPTVKERLDFYRMVSIESHDMAEYLTTISRKIKIQVAQELGIQGELE